MRTHNPETRKPATRNPKPAPRNPETRNHPLPSLIHSLIRFHRHLFLLDRLFKNLLLPQGNSLRLRKRTRPDQLLEITFYDDFSFEKRSEERRVGKECR